MALEPSLEIHKRCKKHDRVVCTICHPVKFVTSPNDKHFTFYENFYKENGRECIWNHKTLEQSLPAPKPKESSSDDLSVLG